MKIRKHGNGGKLEKGMNGKGKHGKERKLEKRKNGARFSGHTTTTTTTSCTATASVSDNIRTCKMLLTASFHALSLCLFVFSVPIPRFLHSPSHVYSLLHINVSTMLSLLILLFIHIFTHLMRGKLFIYWFIYLFFFFKCVLFSRQRDFL